MYFVTYLFQWQVLPSSSRIILRPTWWSREALPLVWTALLLAPPASTGSPTTKSSPTAPGEAEPFSEPCLHCTISVTFFTALSLSSLHCHCLHCTDFFSTALSLSSLHCRCLHCTVTVFIALSLSSLHCRCLHCTVTFHSL